MVGAGGGDVYGRLHHGRWMGGGISVITMMTMMTDCISSGCAEMQCPVGGFSIDINIDTNVISGVGSSMGVAFVAESCGVPLLPYRRAAAPRTSRRPQPNKG